MSSEIPEYLDRICRQCKIIDPEELIEETPISSRKGAPRKIKRSEELEEARSVRERAHRVIILD